MTFISYLQSSSDAFSVVLLPKLLLNVLEFGVIFLFAELLVFCIVTWLNKLSNSEVGELEVLLSSLKKKKKWFSMIPQRLDYFYSDAKCRALFHTYPLSSSITWLCKTSCMSCTISVYGLPILSILFFRALFTLPTCSPISRAAYIFKAI